MKPHGATTDKSCTQLARVKRAAEDRPGRKPGVTSVIENLSPFRADRKSFCRRLRRLTNIFLYRIPGLTPGAIFCRHLRWLIERSIPTGIMFRAVLLFLLFLFPFSFVLSQAN